MTWTPSRPGPASWPPSLHLTEANLLGLDPVVTDADQRAHLDQVIRDLGRPPRHRPHRPTDPALRRTSRRLCRLSRSHRLRQPRRHALEDYVPTTLDRQIVELRDKTCVHPWCNRAARKCDCDHITPFDAGGVTCPKCNLAPLCRHHHRLKTHAGWRYWKVGPDIYLWTDPPGLRYLRTPDGTRQLD